MAYTSHYTNWQMALTGNSTSYMYVQVTFSGGNLDTQFWMTAGRFQSTTGRQYQIPVGSGHDALKLRIDPEQTRFVTAGRRIDYIIQL
jgi:hypothetical protein